ncbi:MAG: hypothetical protein EBY40_08080 [Marivivens sp.]|nr:hypothetical protein [Marivivens sp.]NDH03070.1 hypothetical protein [Marivivens sp.]
MANLSALSRAGIQFSDDQKEVIKSLAQTGRLGEAQALILEELQKQYGGSAEAAAKAGTGPFKQLSNSLGDLQEQFGKLILEFLTPLVPKVKSVLNAFLNLSEGTKRSIVMVAGVLGAAGPLALAVSALIPLFGALLSPIGLVVAAIGALAYVVITNFGEIEKAVVPVINRIIVFNNKTKTLSIIAHLVGNAFIQAFKNVKAAADIVMRSISGTAEALMLVADLEFEKAGEALANAYSDNFDTIVDRGKQMGASMIDAINDGINSEDLELLEVGALSAKVVEFKDELRSMFSASGPGGNVEVPVDLTPAVTKVSTAGLAEVSIADELLDEEHIDTLVSSYEKQMDRVKFATENVGKVMGHIGGAVDAVFANIRDKSMGFHLYMKQMLMDLLQRLIKLVATYAALSVFLGPAGMAKAFGKGGLKGFLLGGMGLGGDVPGFAAGGLVTGPTLGLIGEGPGTSMSNPEVIAPLDKLQSMLGGSAVTVTGRLDGRDILISSERAGFDRNRVRGF